MEKIVTNTAPNQPAGVRRDAKADLSGQQFGDLRVSHIDHVGGHGAKFWHCVCICSGVKVARASELLGGFATTCGAHHSRAQLAWEAQQSVNLTKSPQGHGCRTRLYSIWANMRSRCENPKATKFKDYGARGIFVCDSWKTYSTFASWSLTNGYADDLTLDRIDNYSGYSPGNCRWATTEVQSKNRRIPRKSLTAFGETKTVGEWSRDSRCKIGIKTLSHRVLVGGVPELMLTVLPKPGRSRGMKRPEWMNHA